ncbi:unnamed protein product [Didymodactylos carnosus]|uniref:sphinganine-1-phosphate aldolase n=1 Tax=Didymodactylos carnosus TaxID=1234261 RepID=A0A814BEQ5_9BILA|nr:unnamed protein product [Didymodactylos carnosus]CAF0928251.1 unnamed protein product [Didymodactylos carnosus]CAF3596694.1 unnamed protein product [Didymodactylos carnosus]CAF3706603.1 unnamed protein product [Didymodactylos carnosus]
MPVTAHPAFNKACSYFKIKMRRIPIDPKTLKVDIVQMRRAITKNTCMLVGSAPGFPYGTIDPLEEISELAVQYKVPFHVDACLGGFLIAFMDEAGYELRPFDFRLKGVTSMSCDTHKYGFTLKGTSVILYRDSNIRSHQFFAVADWPGGIYISPSVAGSRSGFLIACCWATMMYYGHTGYVKETKKIIEASRAIADGWSNIEGLYLVGEPQVSVVAVGSKRFNIYYLLDALQNLGWHLNGCQNPAAIHIAVTQLHTLPNVIEKLISDTKESVNKILSENMKNDTPTIVFADQYCYDLLHIFKKTRFISCFLCLIMSSSFLTDSKPPLGTDDLLFSASNQDLLLSHSGDAGEEIDDLNDETFGESVEKIKIKSDFGENGEFIEDYPLQEEETNIDDQMPSIDALVGDDSASNLSTSLGRLTTNYMEQQNPFTHQQQSPLNPFFSDTTQGLFEQRASPLLPASTLDVNNFIRPLPQQQQQQQQKSFRPTPQMPFSTQHIQILKQFEQTLISIDTPVNERLMLMKQMMDKIQRGTLMQQQQTGRTVANGNNIHYSQHQRSPNWMDSTNQQQRQHQLPPSKPTPRMFRAEDLEREMVAQASSTNNDDKQQHSHLLTNGVGADIQPQLMPFHRPQISSPVFDLPYRPFAAPPRHSNMTNVSMSHQMMAAIQRSNQIPIQQQPHVPPGPIQRPSSTGTSPIEAVQRSRTDSDRSQQQPPSHQHVYPPQSHNKPQRLYPRPPRLISWRNQDDYAGLMNDREKQWVVKIQLLQVTPQSTDDDYYYHKWSQNKKQTQGIQGKQQQQQQFPLHQQQISQPVAALLRSLTSNAQDDQRSSQQQFFGAQQPGSTAAHHSLGKVSTLTAKHPRYVIDLEGNRTIVKTSKCITHDKYDLGVLLNIEDIHHDLLKLDSNGGEIVDKQMLQSILKRYLFNDKYLFGDMFLHRKGQIVLERIYLFVMANDMNIDYCEHILVSIYSSLSYMVTKMISSNLVFTIEHLSMNMISLMLQQMKKYTYEQFLEMFYKYFDEKIVDKLKEPKEHDQTNLSPSSNTLTRSPSGPFNDIVLFCNSYSLTLIIELLLNIERRCLSLASTSASAVTTGLPQELQYHNLSERINTFVRELCQTLDRCPIAQLKKILKPFQQQNTAQYVQLMRFIQLNLFDRKDLFQQIEPKLAYCLTKVVQQ